MTLRDFYWIVCCLVHLSFSLCKYCCCSTQQYDNNTVLPTFQHLAGKCPLLLPHCFSVQGKIQEQKKWSWRTCLHRESASNLPNTFGICRIADYKPDKGLEAESEKKLAGSKTFVERLEAYWSIILQWVSTSGIWTIYCMVLCMHRNSTAMFN